MERRINNKTIAGLDVTELPGDPDGATILLLHGFGANSMDLFPLSGVYRQTPRPTWLFPNAPLTIPGFPGDQSRAWFPLDIEIMQRAIRTQDFQVVKNAFPSDLRESRTQIERLVGELDIPFSKLIIGGFSQGAVLATETLLHGRERAGGLLIFSGTLVFEPDWRKLSTLHAKTPFFQSHGLYDPLLPIEQAQKLEQVLLEGGLKGKLRIFKGGHEIPSGILGQLQQFLSHLLS